MSIRKIIQEEIQSLFFESDYSLRSFELTEDEYNYLLPALIRRLHYSDGKYYFIADDVNELEDMLNRLKGYYDNYDELKNMIVYICFKQGDLNPFRESMGV